MRREKNKERRKKKDQKQRRGSKYGRVKLRQARRGVVSCSIAGLVAGAIFLLVGITYVMKGKAAGFIGGFGISAMIFTVVGIVTAVKGFKEREKNYLTCKIGIGLNIFLLVTLFIFFLGGIL